MNVYEIVTEEILARLEKGEIPWIKPWTGGGYPKNLVSKKEYRGINVFMLAASCYTSPYWLSYKQCQDLGGQVRKGEKSTAACRVKQAGRPNMLIKTITVYEQTCRRCGHKWDTRSEHPIECPKCKRRDWNRETKLRKYTKKGRK